MFRKSSFIALIFSLIAVIFSVTGFMISMRSAESIKNASIDDGDIQYTMYIGTNDKDTNEPVCTHEEAMQIVEDILVEHLGGFTLQEANGGWKDGETLYREYSIVARISDAKEEDVRASADDLIRVLNQSSILIESNRSRTEFYSGQ